MTDLPRVVGTQKIAWTLTACEIYCIQRGPPGDGDTNILKAIYNAAIDDAVEEVASFAATSPHEANTQEYLVDQIKELKQ